MIKDFSLFNKNVTGGLKATPTRDTSTAQKMKFSIKDFFSKCD